MGLLDDAIREHLELKRRHGADPDEVTRQEREALGAPVRGEFAKPAGEEPDEGDEPAAVAAGGQAPAEVPEFDEPPEMPGEPEPEPVERAIAPEPEPEPEPGDEEDPWLVEELADPEPRPEPAAEAAEAAAARRPRRGRGRARGDAGVPAGDAGARAPVVRAEASARLRLGQVALDF